MRRRFLSVVSVLAATVGVVGVVNVAASSAAPIQPIDDTQLIKNAIRNFAARGVVQGESNLVVRRTRTADGMNEVFVLSRDMRFRTEEGGRDAAGRMLTRIVPTATAIPASPAGRRLLAPSWLRNNHDCYDTGIQNPDDGRYWAIRTVCWQFDWQQADHDPNREYWQFKLDATGRSTDFYGRKMKRMWVESKRQPNSPAVKLDRQPSPASEVIAPTGCRQQSLTISTGVPITVGISYTKTLCETWTPKSYPDTVSQAHWSNTWRNGATMQQREVAFNIGFSTGAGQGVVLDLYTGQEIG